MRFPVFRQALILFSLVLIAAATSGQKASRTSAGSPQKGYLGVVFHDVDPDELSEMGVHQPAVVVDRTMPGSPAEKTGLQPNDLITEVDHQPATDATMVRQLLSRHHVGDKIPVTILHLMPEAGRSLQLELEMVMAPAPGEFQQLQANLDNQNREGGDFGNPVPQGNVVPRSRGGTSAGMHLIDERRAIIGVPRRQGFCAAVLPPDWTFVPGQDGSNVEASSPGDNAHAGWMIRAINPAMRAYYGGLYGPPDEANATVLQVITHAPVSYTSPASQNGYFAIRNFQSGRYSGSVLYHVFPAPWGSPPGSYIMSTYVAYGDARDPQMLQQAVAVMTTLQCTTQLHPSEPASVGGHGSKSGGHGERDSLKDYNAQTGKQWVHSPSTGRSMMVDATTEWNENGPAGPGYYRQAGNALEKMEPGFQ